MMWSGTDPTRSDEVLQSVAPKPPRFHPKKEQVRRLADQLGGPSAVAALAGAVFVISCVSASTGATIDTSTLEQREPVSVSPPDDPATRTAQDPFDFAAAEQQSWSQAVRLLEADGEDVDNVVEAASKVVDAWRNRPWRGEDVGSDEDDA